MGFGVEELAGARELVGRHVPPTPQYPWPLLAERYRAEVWVKHENHTPTGSFKVRGGLVLVARLRAARPEITGIVSATRGNHGQSLAFAGRAHGLSVTIVVPEHNSVEKNAAMRAFGAELVVVGRDFQAAREHAEVLGAGGGRFVVPSFHRDLVLGVATYAAELFAATGPLDAIYVPVGMGSGICGLIAVRDLLGYSTEIIGVVAENAPAMARSFAARRAVSTEEAATFVDGVACRVPDPDAVAAIVAGAARVIALSEDEAAEAMRLMYASTHNVAEPAGALALAGLERERAEMAGRRVAVIHSGANVDSDRLATVLTGATPRP
ncbi:MAG: threonine dehydratase [Actinomycetota bacterium]|nr:threonine dehydratase [Actinomycetota bacterium]